MCKFYLLLYLLCTPFFLLAQSISIAQQDFDEPTLSWNYTSDIPFFDNASRGFFGIHDGDADNDTFDTGIAQNADEITFQNIQNDFLFINDLNNDPGLGTSEEAILTFETLVVDNYTNVVLSFDYEIIGFENADYIRYQIIENGIPSAAIELPKDGQGSVSIPISNNTENISLLIIIHQNALADFAAIDNIKLTGELKSPCSELIISEYVEGNSSNEFNNNFLEIYNPTNQNISLENYSLQIYSGANSSPYSTLQLSGNIPSYGTFLIEDDSENLNITANLSTNSAVLNFTGNDKIALRHNDKIIDLIGIIGEDTDFAKDITLRRKSDIQLANSQYNLEEWDVYELENTTNLNLHTSSCSGPIPEIQVFGNTVNINDDSSKTLSENNTYFGQADIDSEEEIQKTFGISNTGSATLELTDIVLMGKDAADFEIIDFQPQQILAGNKTEFSILFQPNTMGVKTAVLQISNNDASESPFQFTIQAEGTGTSNSPIIISQYYEGNSNNKWLEVTNISPQEIENATYYLAIFSNQDALNPLSNLPSAKIAIPNLIPGQSITFRAILNVDTPSYAINSEEIATRVCTFTGDDIIVISTSEDENCWQNRVDIIGNSSLWGGNTNFTRKFGCDEIASNTKFIATHWVSTTIDEVNNANTDDNNRLGVHFTGTTEYNSSGQWTNGVPNKFKRAIINQDYDASIAGSIEACSITIPENVEVHISANHHILAVNDLIVHGTLNLQHESSLIMLENDGFILNSGTINIHKNTAPIKPYDYTYWSSPIINANINTVFATSPQNAIYAFDTTKYADSNLDQEDDNGDAWQIFSGAMEIGKGYATMAPNTNPFQNIQSVIFNGTPNNGIYYTPIYLSENINNTDNDWNLIGNPYPSAVDIDAFYHHANNANILAGSFYFWTHQTSLNTEGNSKYSADDYAIYTVGTGGVAATPEGEIPNGYIASTQGFFVEALQAGNIEWTNPIRASNNHLFFKSEIEKKKSNTKKDKIWLNLSNNNGAFSQILIGFLPESSKDYLPKFDGKRRESGNYLSFYSFKEDNKLAIQGTNLLQKEEIIPLGFDSKINEQTTLEIAVAKVEGSIKEQAIYLYDKLANKYHDLTKSNYTFTLENMGVYDNRFSLHFKTTSLDVQEIKRENDNLLISQNTDEIKIYTLHQTTIKELRIYDLLGRNLITKKAAATVIKWSKNSIPTHGVYIVRASLENGRILQKKVFL